MNKVNVSTLPILSHKKEIISALKRFQILILVAETGSGKTIFVPYLLSQSGIYSKIIISQTRRIAAISAANFLSKIFNSRVGKKIGYSVRFENMSDKNTEVKFVTDGVFFQEMLQDSKSLNECCLIIDEFHERTIYTDLILGLIKKKVSFQKNIKIILMSASGDSEKLAHFFGRGVGKIKIPGRLFKTKIYYTRFTQEDFISAVCSTIFNLHASEKKAGNILVFLPGQEEIEEVFFITKFLLSKNFKNFKLYKLYANLPFEEQTLVFKLLPRKIRKIILSTNITETSITLPGTRIVIDCGLSRQKISNWKTGINLLKTFPISKSEAIQRAGRSSREKSGKCFRLYPIREYKKLRNFPLPEIRKMELSSVLLQLFCYNLKNTFEIDLIDWPPRWEIIKSLELLFIMRTLTKKLKPTRLGKLIAVFPLDVKLSKSILEALWDGCPSLIDWILTGSSILTSDHFLRIEFISKKFQENKKEKLGKKSDHFFMVLWFKNFSNQDLLKKKRDNKEQKILFENIGKQIEKIKEYLKKISEAIFPFFKRTKSSVAKDTSFFTKFCFCFTSGFFLNSAKSMKRENKFICLLSGLVVEIHNSSILKKENPSLVIFHEIFLTKKIFIRGLSPIRFSWLIFFGEKIFF